MKIMQGIRGGIAALVFGLMAALPLGLSGPVEGQSIGGYPPGGTGTVTSVALSAPSFITVTGSPVTTNGTLTQTLASQTANTAFIAPNGSAGVPTFRALVGADIPAVNLAAGGAGGVTGILPIANGGSGTNSVATNLIFASPNGSTGAPAFRSLVGADIPAINLAAGGAGGVTGILPIANGGSGAASVAQNLFFSSPNGSTGAPSFRAMVGADLPLPAASTLGGVKSAAAAANAVGSGVDTSGNPTFFTPNNANVVAWTGYTPANRAGDTFGGAVTFNGDITTGHQIAQGTAPTLSTCGTGPTIVGHDTAGRVTSGTSATACTVTFAAGYSVAPSCIVSFQTGAQNPYGLTSATGSFTVSWTGSGAIVFNYQCIGL